MILINCFIVVLFEKNFNTLPKLSPVHLSPSLRPFVSVFSAREQFFFQVIKMAAEAIMLFHMSKMSLQENEDRGCNILLIVAIILTEICLK
jgi:hypothetical protein